MGESLYGKFGTDLVIIGFVFFIIYLFLGMIGVLMPEIASMIFTFWILGFILIIGGIVLAIVGIIKDELREKAIRALIGGILFLIVGIAILVVFNMLKTM